MSSKRSKNSPNLASLLKKTKEEAEEVPRKAAPREPLPLTVRSISLSPSTTEILDGLMADSAKKLGRKVSASAVVRALLRGTEGGAFAAQEVAKLIEAELNTGEVIWGRERRNKVDS